VCWRYEWKAQSAKWDKPPINPRTGRYALVNNPKTWATFDVALAAVRRLGLDGVGLVLTGEDDVWGGDLDHCIDDAGHYSDLAAKALVLAETYWEVSPSGGGIRFFARGQLDNPIKDDGLGVEMYGAGRYLTVTGNQVPDTPDYIAEATDTLALLTEAVEGRRMRNSASTNGHATSNHAANDIDDYERASQALSFIPADDYDPYIRIGMALKDGFGSAGFELYRGWAAKSSKFDEADLRAKWKSFKRENGVTLRTLFGLAIEHGWREERRQEMATANVQQQPSADPRTEEPLVPWPALSQAATRGLAGEIARVATVDSETDPVSVMLTSLTGIGALLGRSRYVRVSDTEHHPRLMCALVGSTSRARKGTSWPSVKRVLRRAEALIPANSTRPYPLGLPLRISRGPLSSGEGIAAAIQDREPADDAGSSVGTDDKRLLVIEGEFGAALRAMQRQGNTLSMVLRTAWDGDDIEPLTKRDRVVVTKPHIAIVAHITRHELRELLSASDVWGGLANRLLWACVRRQQAVAMPKPISDQDLDRIASELARVAKHVASPHEMRLTNSATALWANVYPELTQDRPGLLGAATARAEAQVLRLALTYALIDGADDIGEEHLEAGLAMWRYADDSATYLFGGVETDPVAQRIIEFLATGPKSQTEIRDMFGRHRPSSRIWQALTDLQERGVVECVEEPTRGRPRRVWRLKT
jgi:hypothetical protein